MSRRAKVLMIISLTLTLVFTTVRLLLIPAKDAIVVQAGILAYRGIAGAFTIVMLACMAFFLITTVAGTAGVKRRRKKEAKRLKQEMEKAAAEETAKEALEEFLKQQGEG